MHVQPLWFLDQGEYVLRLARCDSRQRVLRVESLQEFTASDSAALAQALRGAITEPAGTLLCLVRPKAQRIHLATTEEARRNAGPAGVRQFLRLPENAAADPGWAAAVDAASGNEPGSAPWLAASSPASSLQEALATLPLKPLRCTSGTLALAGALAGAVAGPTLLLEIGGERSSALLIDRGRVRGAASLTLNRATISEAIQVELGLKFRGSADKLFFNPDYDFSDVAAGIAGRLIAGLQADLGPLLAQFKPVALHVGSLGSSQQWLGAQLSSALHLPLFAPDLKGWCGTAEVTFATPAVEATAGPAWFGFLHSLAAQARAGSVTPWQPEWRVVENAALPAAAAPAGTASRPAGVSPPQPAAAAAVVPRPAPPAVVPPTTPTPGKPAAPAPAPAPKPPAVTAESAPKSAKSAVPPPAAKPGVPAKKNGPEPLPVTRPAAATPQAGPPAASSVSYPPKPASAAREQPGARPKADAAPAKPANGGTPPAPAAPDAAGRPAVRQRKPLVMAAAAAAVVVLLIVVFFWMQHNEAARLLADKQKAEQRLQAEQERARLAEQKARDEAEAREKTARELSLKLNAAESARQQAEKEAQAQAAARLANARGTLVLKTDPAGATVTVGALPPQTSPASFAGIKTGKYPVVVTLAGYDEVRLNLEVNENATTDAGTIKLVRAMGTLEIASVPTGVAYEVHPANSLVVGPQFNRSGQTPATIGDLPPGSYTVTLAREGWKPHVQTVTVARTAPARVAWELPTGLIRIVSDPSGANVRRNGVQIGVTPLDLGEQPPGAVELELTQPDFDQPVVVKGDVEPGKALELSAPFPAKDRIYRTGEFDTKPEPTSSKPPSLPYYLTLEKGRIEIELVVTRDGTTKDLRVVSSSNPDYAKYCIEALGKWRFKPALVKGKPVNARISIPLIFKATNSNG